MNYSEPYLIEFPKLGKPEIGYISVGEVSKQLPFDVKRVFWTYYTPESIVRGRHAHLATEQLLIAVSGRIIVTTQLAGEEIKTFNLDAPNVGLYVPPNAWHTMQYSHTAVQVVLASTLYNEEDYIRDYDKFLKTYL